MTHQEFRAIWKASGMTLRQLADYLRISHPDTVRHWADGKNPITGPVSKLMEQLIDGRL